MLPITCDDYPELLELMTHDKKNMAGVINFTLLGGVGDIRINQTATKEEIHEALDFFVEGCNLQQKDSITNKCKTIPVILALSV